MHQYKLLLGDCLTEMAKVPSGSVDLVLTDPPYNIGKSKDWDSFRGSTYIPFMGQVFAECERILKPNGTLYFFHNDMLQIAELMTWLKDNTNLRYNSFIVLDKGDWRALAWKNPSETSNLRCWFNTCEYCLCYVKGDCLHTEWNRTGWDHVRLDVNNFTTLRKYCYEMLCYIGGDSLFNQTHQQSPRPSQSGALLLLQGEGVSLTK